MSARPSLGFKTRTVVGQLELTRRWDWQDTGFRFDDFDLRLLGRSQRLDDLEYSVFAVDGSICGVVQFDAAGFEPDDGHEITCLLVAQEGFLSSLDKDVVEVYHLLVVEKTGTEDMAGVFRRVGAGEAIWRGVGKDGSGSFGHPIHTLPETYVSVV